MPLWRRRSKREVRADGPPVLPHVVAPNGQRRISLSLPQLRGSHTFKRSSGIEVEENYGQGQQVLNTFSDDSWPSRVASSTDVPRQTAPTSPPRWNSVAGRSPIKRTGIFGPRPGSANKDIKPPVNYSRPTTPAKAASPQSLAQDEIPPTPLVTPPRKRDRGPPPSSFPGAVSYNLQSDFRTSPAVHAAAQSAGSPQARRSVVESARIKSLRKSRAATRLNLMVVGEPATGKTLFLRSLLQTLLTPSEDCGTMLPDKEQHQKAAAFGLSKGRPVQTRRLERVDGIDLTPSSKLLLNGRSQASQQLADEHRARVGRSNSVSSRTSMATALLGPDAPPSRLSIGVIDTPSLPTSLPASMASLAKSGHPVTPYFMQPIIDEITARYARTLREETKLRRTLSKGGASEGEHIHLVVWFIEPREILHGARSWWKEQQDQQRWDKRGKAHTEMPSRKKKVAGDVVPLANNHLVEKSHTLKSNEQLLHQKPERPRRRALSNPGRPGLTSSASLNKLPPRETTADTYALSRGRAQSMRSPGAHVRNASVPVSASARVPTDTGVPPLPASSLTNGSGAESTNLAHVPSRPPQTREPDAPVESTVTETDDDDEDEPPYVPNLSPSQKLTLLQLLPLVPVLPIVAKAETLTANELRIVRAAVQRGWLEVTEKLRENCAKSGARAVQLQWGWIGFEDQAELEMEPSSHQDTSAVVESGGGDDVKRVRIKSRRSYSSSAGQGRVDISGAVAPTDDPSITESARGSDESPGIEFTKPLFERPVSSSSLARRGDQSSSQASTGLNSAEPDARTLLGVEDVVPSPTELVERWPLAIWAPDASSSNHRIHDKSRTKATDLASGTSFIDGTSTARRGQSHPVVFPHPLSLTRAYPWGSTLDLLDPKQSDFLALKCMLLGTHTSAILETSKEAFEDWRRETLERAVNQQQGELSRTAPTGPVRPVGEKDKGWVIV